MIPAICITTNHLNLGTKRKGKIISTSVRIYSIPAAVMMCRSVWLFMTEEQRSVIAAAWHQRNQQNVVLTRAFSIFIS